jgi:hypothetical protein
MAVIPESNLIVRTSRKEWACAGDGARHPQHATGCPRRIGRGDRYVECMEAASTYESGSRHSLACASEFLGWTVAQ